MTGKQDLLKPPSAVPRGPTPDDGQETMEARRSFSPRGSTPVSLSEPNLFRRLHNSVMPSVWAMALSVTLCLNSVLLVQAQSPETPLTRLRPIDAPSAVDRYLRSPQGQQRTNPDSPAVADAVVADSVVTAQWESSAQPATWAANRSDAHTVRAQFQLPENTAPPAAPSDATLMPPPSLGTTQPPSTGTVLGPTNPTVMPPGPPFAAPAPGSTAPTMPLAPPSAPPRGLPMGPTSPVAPIQPSTIQPGMGPVTSSSDLSPLAQPQLNDQFATIDNCSCVSPPSGYVAATGWTQCAPTTSFAVTPTTTPYLAPSATTVVPAPVAGAPVIPDASTMPKGSGVPRHSLISFGQDRNPIVVGQGIVGQPVAYVPGQPVRNWLRWLFP
jgi:hypothetical protein